VPPAKAAATPGLDHDGWIALVASSDLAGPARQLAAHASFLGHADGVLRLALPPEDAVLRKSVRALEKALAPTLGGKLQVKFEDAAPDGAGETLHQRSQREHDARREAAEAGFLADPGIRQLMQRHGATVVPDSIRPHDK
jgi:DNA polymerase-3 subunit gamma/tau